MIRQLLRSASPLRAFSTGRTWNVYLSGEIHSSWREVIGAGARPRAKRATRRRRVGANGSAAKNCIASERRRAGRGDVIVDDVNPLRVATRRSRDAAARRGCNAAARRRYNAAHRRYDANDDDAPNAMSDRRRR